MMMMEHFALGDEKHRVGSTLSAAQEFNFAVD